MRRRMCTAAVVGLAAVAALGVAGPAAAAPAPRANASCVGQVFVPQATGAPGTVAARIAEIKGFIDVPFGVVIGDFARWTDCSG